MQSLHLIKPVFRQTSFAVNPYGEGASPSPKQKVKAGKICYNAKKYINMELGDYYGNN